MSSLWSLLTNSIKKTYARTTSKTSNPLDYCPLMAAQSLSMTGTRSNSAIVSLLPLLSKAAAASNVASEFHQQERETDHQEQQHENPLEHEVDDHHFLSLMSSNL
jgi:hypothetical protein